MTRLGRPPKLVNPVDLRCRVTLQQREILEAGKGGISQAVRDALDLWLSDETRPLPLAAPGDGRLVTIRAQVERRAADDLDAAVKAIDTSRSAIMRAAIERWDESSGRGRK